MENTRLFPLKEHIAEYRYMMYTLYRSGVVELLYVKWD